MPRLFFSLPSLRSGHFTVIGLSSKLEQFSLRNDPELERQSGVHDVSVIGIGSQRGDVDAALPPFWSRNQRPTGAPGVG